MPTGTHSESLMIDGMVFNRTKNISADNASKFGDSAAPITLVAATAITAWVKTDANTASCTLPASHGLSSGTYDVYWPAGLRYGVAGTVTDNTLALDGGTGDDFPASATADMFVAVQQQVNVPITGSLAAMIGVLSTVRGHIDFQDSGNATVRAFEMLANEADNWDSEQAKNLYSGNAITKAKVSNGTATAGTLQIAVLQDSTP